MVYIVVWFSFRVREVGGSIPPNALFESQKSFFFVFGKVWFNYNPPLQKKNFFIARLKKKYFLPESNRGPTAC